MPQQHIWLLPQNWGYLVSFGTYFFKNFTKIFQKWLFWSVWESSICKVKKEETIHFTHFNMAIDYVRGVFSRHTLSPNRVKLHSYVLALLKEGLVTRLRKSWFFFHPWSAIVCLWSLWSNYCYETECREGVKQWRWKYKRTWKLK